MGPGYSGGEPLLLAIGACYCNDLYREAAKRSIPVRSVHVDVACDWGGEPITAQNVTLAARVEAEASEEATRDLMAHTGRVAEIPNSLKLGPPVTLASMEAVSVADDRVT